MLSNNMPFTFSHPVVVLPLRLLPKKWTSLTGLVIGSIVPDFEKFLKMEAGNTFSHRWEGIFWFNIPLGICIALLFHAVVRDPLIENLPLILRQKLICFRGYNWSNYFRKNFFAVILSIFLGAVSHISLDDLTHNKGLALQFLPFLTDRITLWNYSVQLFQLLDFFCSIVGGIMILYLILQLPPTRIKNERSKRFVLYWLLVMITALLTVLIRILCDPNMADSWDLLFTSISAVLIGFIVSSITIKYCKGNLLGHPS